MLSDERLIPLMDGAEQNVRKGEPCQGHPLYGFNCSGAQVPRGSVPCQELTEVYSRVCGFFRPVQQWNRGKRQEYKDRQEYKP